MIVVAGALAGAAAGVVLDGWAPGVRGMADVVNSGGVDDGVRGVVRAGNGSDAACRDPRCATLPLSRVATDEPDLPPVAAALAPAGERSLADPGVRP